MHATCRAYKIWHRYAPKLLLSTALYSAFSALAPYVPIYFSAQILNELAGARSPERLTELVMLTIAVTAALAAVTALLRRWKEIHEHTVYHSNLFIQIDKMLSMDFQAADAPQTHTLLSQIWQNTNWFGHGLILPDLVSRKADPACFRHSGRRRTFRDALHRAGARIGRRVRRAQQSAHHRAGAAASARRQLPLPVFFEPKSAMWVARSTGSAKETNRFFIFNITAMRDRCRAPDARIYRQDRLLLHYANTVNEFCTQGTFAKCARGPMGLWAGAAAAVSAVSPASPMRSSASRRGPARSRWAASRSMSARSPRFPKASARSSPHGASSAQTRFSLRQTFKFLDTPNEMYQGSLTTEKRSDRNYEIEFCDVSFRYPGAEDYALRHVSMKFRIGERLAVVGENGSGKTTFIKLLCRLYDPTEGTILLNGIDIRKYDYDEYIALFSVVFRISSSFSLGQNVATAVQYSPERAKACLQRPASRPPFAASGRPRNEALQGFRRKRRADLGRRGRRKSPSQERSTRTRRSSCSTSRPPRSTRSPRWRSTRNSTRSSATKRPSTSATGSPPAASATASPCSTAAASFQRGTHETLVRDAGGKYAALWNAQAQYYTAR